MLTNWVNALHVLFDLKPSTRPIPRFVIYWIDHRCFALADVASHSANKYEAVSWRSMQFDIDAVDADD